jgi:HSP20 family protein
MEKPDVRQVPVPPGVKSIDLLEQEIRQLKDCLTQQTSYYQYPATLSWPPQVESYSTDEEYVISADLPGVSRADVSLSVSNGFLVIKGERPFQKPEGLKESLCFEKVYGPFYRQIPLPRDADWKRIEAKSKNGVLQITIPRNKESEKESKIKIT